MIAFVFALWGTLLFCQNITATKVQCCHYSGRLLLTAEHEVLLLLTPKHKAVLLMIYIYQTPLQAAAVQRCCMRVLLRHDTDWGKSQKRTALLTHFHCTVKRRQRRDCRLRSTIKGHILLRNAAQSDKSQQFLFALLQCVLQQTAK